jgi:hypothetical protein
LLSARRSATKACREEGRIGFEYPLQILPGKPEIAGMR